VATVRQWAKDLPRGGSVLDLGCGNGWPISGVLIEAGVVVHGVDASPSMIAAFRARFRDAQAECSAVEDSHFFGRTFDGIIAWGLMFLLRPEAQSQLIHKVARALKNGGRFLFTSPWQVCQWSDNLTGQTSVSLGSEEYRRVLEAEGLVLVGEADDEGENHYFLALKP
jgi:cyclopropane fatty-acyl-phospholipid synthase-like methyltransferase